MSDRKTILVVDDSPNEIRVLMENLKSEYAVLTATSGERAINIVADSSPDLVLLDVNMEPMNGYETCSIMLQNSPTLPIVFVSANTQTEEILKGFDAGGRDYITKPIDPEVMKSKVAVLLRQAEEQRKLDSEKNEASVMAKVALTSASDLNLILNFLKAAAKSVNHQELSQLVGEACKQFGLSASVQLRGLHNERVNFSNSGVLSAVEQEILLNASNMEGRYMERGARLIINCDSVSLFIKTMPDRQDPRYSELKDYLLALCQSAHEIGDKIKADMYIAEQRVAMVLEAVKDANETLGSIQKFQADYKTGSLRLMDELLEEVESNFFNMGLTETQEQTISSIIQRKLNEGLEHMEAGLKMDDKLKRLMASLKELTSSL